MSMDRRTFLRRASLLAAGIVAVDQLELLERLTWEPRRLWTGWSPAPDSEISAMFKKVYEDAIFDLPFATPFLAQLRPRPLRADDYIVFANKAPSRREYRSNIAWLKASG